MKGLGVTGGLNLIQEDLILKKLLETFVMFPEPFFGNVL